MFEYSGGGILLRERGKGAKLMVGGSAERGVELRIYWGKVMEVIMIKIKINKKTYVWLKLQYSCFFAPGRGEGSSRPSLGR